MMLALASRDAVLVRDGTEFQVANSGHKARYTRAWAGTKLG